MWAAYCEKSKPPVWTRPVARPPALPTMLHRANPPKNRHRPGCSDRALRVSLKADAERPERHSHAERRNDHHPTPIVPIVGMQPVTLRVTS